MECFLYGVIAEDAKDVIATPVNAKPEALLLNALSRWLDVGLRLADRHKMPISQ